MNNSLKLILLQCLLPALLTVDCPNGGEPMAKENMCLYYYPSVPYYLEAQVQCASIAEGIFGIPAKIQNSFDNALVTARANGTTPFIGVQWGIISLQWQYADGSELTYKNWAQDEPGLGWMCATIDPKSGKWKTADCWEERPVLCTVDVSYLISTPQLPTLDPTKACPPGWVYYIDTNSCYYLQNFTYSDGVHWKLYKWAEAETICQSMGAHLVSIHSLKENNFVFDLIKSNVSYVNPSAAPYYDPCDSTYSWMGYYGTGHIGVGNWTDGTQFDYNYNLAGRGTDYLWWTMTNDPSCTSMFSNPKQWWVADHDYDTYPRFVCKMLAKRSTL